ncbi:1-deoxy-D-xylulose-5-phosphate synthase [Mumia sp. zg.B17]|uniref:1-deoxy-D-xylulose-5-phosphate synthase n=1 Tax=unclassified Mumia TaxID=2621872 RepID=UPI001C6EF57A|nr:MULTISPECIES: 1-deoxy-D-xylulose-5-phosphate synthase [unclassified Mumia]MBW9205262.1 1-deoxy-D-xylulose-5-phosphate synthase [Mumia sp. zg.B17]MBW9208739.1 1-deoxy-D-xylulose-5-phosphate synthase [Mumia sp. zg.B21]
MSTLDRISQPSDLRDLTDPELDALAEEIRERLIVAVATHGGHLGPNLGVVELTMAIHRVFDSPRDRVIFDTGHQAYVHKMLTGRAAEFENLRTEGGLSGYPSQAESAHDVVENSHASTSLSYADGLAKANMVTGRPDHVIAVIGDGALTGGMAWEALNNIAANVDRRLVVVVNDNGRSYRPTVGGLANHLARLRTNPRYEPTLKAVRERLTQTNAVGQVTYEALHAIKKGLKDALYPQGMFEDLGLKYIGPIDGHDRPMVEEALARARTYGGPAIVHVITTKGQGYEIAVANEEDQMHQAKAFDRLTGEALAVEPTSWTSVFRDELVRIGDERRDVVAITAAMLSPTGLDAFADKFPERTYDVGIAEQHAVTSAAGLAMGGLHPVVAVYATFLNRAFDQVLLDVALHRCGVTFVLDRAGVTGDDGPSHNGMWDMSILQVVPTLQLAAPRDGTRLRELLREAVAVDDAPTVVRFPKGGVSDDVEAVDVVGRSDVLLREGAEDVLVVAAGPMVHQALDAAALLRAEGVGVTVVDPRWVKPLDPALVELAARHRLLVTIEDSGRVGGMGSVLTQMLADADVRTPVRVHGVTQEFFDHAKRAVLLERMGLTGEAVAADTLARL